LDKSAALQRRLQYEFDDPQLLAQALTHRSRAAKNYERLEFLGDSILGFVTAEWLFNQFPNLDEGRLSRMRSSLVRKETLALVARDLELGSDLLLGEGEMKSGGFNRDSILADTVESLIGAIYLDSEFAQARDFIFRNFANYFAAISLQSSFKDAKSQLQEVMQKKSMQLPQYNILESSGEHHELQFSVECQLLDLPISATCTASSRRLAEQKAAAIVLRQLNQKGGK
jgi:ribonuclease-3